MKKSIVIMFLTLLLFVSFGLVSNSAAHNNQPILANPTATPKVLAKIERLELDKNRIFGCQEDERFEESSECNDDGLVKVSTFVNNPKNLALSYQYTVSGGKIIGEGANVIWNLENVRPQTYTITISIKGNRKVSAETISKTVEVIDCPCEVFCTCPLLSVAGGGEVKAGENIFFTANVSGIKSPVRYKWTISDGEIIKGQGTSEITVKTNSSLIGKSITATVEIEYDEMCDTCLRTASETGSVIE